VASAYRGSFLGRGRSGGRLFAKGAGKKRHDINQPVSEAWADTKGSSEARLPTECKTYRNLQRAENGANPQASVLAKKKGMKRKLAPQVGRTVLRKNSAEEKCGPGSDDIEGNETSHQILSLTGRRGSSRGDSLKSGTFPRGSQQFRGATERRQGTV